MRWLCKLLAALMTAASVLGQTAGSSFTAGYNHPWAAYGHDFGANAWGHDGVIASGWTYQTFQDTQGFADARRVEVSNCDGRPALRITANLQGQTVDRSSGEVELSIANHPPRSGPVTAPVQSLDLEGVAAHVRLWLPPGSAGPSGARNGFELFFKSRLSDTDFPTLRSGWLNVDPAWEGKCVDLPLPSFPVSNTGPGSRFGAFDARSVAIIGFKIGINSGSTARITGFIDMQSFTLQTNPPTVFDFEKLEFERDYEGAAVLTGGNLNVARVFVFADGRAAPEFGQDGSVTGLDPHVKDDFAELLRIAEKTKTRIIPVLLDFGWCSRAKSVSGVQLGGHSDIIRDPGKRQSFVTNALEPLLLDYGKSPWIHSWDIINEPEWVMQGLSSERIEGLEPDKVSVGDMQQFVRLCADAIHSLAPTQPATVGSARRKWLPYWTTVGLGLYQFHWYDKFQPEELFPFPPAGELGLDKPILIGEVPTSEAQLSDGRQVAGTRYKAGEFLEAARAGGYGGLLFWSFRAADQESDVGRAAVDLMSRVPRFFSAGTRNAASFQNRLAANMLGTLLGENLAQAPLSAPWLPPPTRLGSTSVTVTDSSGRQESAPLLFASPTQIYLLMPDLTATGQGTLTVDRLDGFPSAAAIRLDPVAPGLFSLDADGSGVAAATAVCVAANGSQTAPPVFRCGTSPRSCVPVPIDLGDEGTRCQLTFYGTGIRGRGSPAVVGATIGGSAVPILYAGPQAQISGLDQVNLEIPRSLVGRGLVDVVVVADGVASNAVTIQLR